MLLMIEFTIAGTIIAFLITILVTKLRIIILNHNIKHLDIANKRMDLLIKGFKIATDTKNKSTTKTTDMHIMLQKHGFFKTLKEEKNSLKRAIKADKIDNPNLKTN